jgi:hypothetical protein
LKRNFNIEEIIRDFYGVEHASLLHIIQFLIYENDSDFWLQNDNLTVKYTNKPLGYNSNRFGMRKKDE